MKVGNALAGVDRRIDGFVAAARRGYNRYTKKIVSLFFAIAVFASTFFLLETIPFFPSNWVIFISSIASLVSFRSKSKSFALLWLTTSISLLYQNVITGAISFVLYPIIAGKFRSSEPIKQLLYLASISQFLHNAGSAYESRQQRAAEYVCFYCQE